MRKKPGYIPTNGKQKWSVRQKRFHETLITSSNLGEAAVKAGYSPKHARQSGHQALKAIRGRVPDLLDRLGLSEEHLIDKHLRRHLNKKQTKFIREEKIVKQRTGRRVEEVVRHVVTKYVVDDNQTQLRALQTGFMLHGSYAPRDPKEAAQFGVKVIVNNLGLIRDGSMPVIDIKPGMKVPEFAIEAKNGNKKNGNKTNGNK